jgi:hypothetical protein
MTTVAGTDKTMPQPHPPTTQAQKHADSSASASKTAAQWQNSMRAWLTTANPLTASAYGQLNSNALSSDLTITDNGSAASKHI